MALKALLLKRKIEEMNGRMAALSQHTGELTQREAELEQAMDEARTEEDLRSVEQLVEEFTAEQRTHQEAIIALQREIDAAQEELRTLEAQQPKDNASTDTTPASSGERKDENMTNRQTRAFGAMTMEQRSAFIQREEVQEFLTRFRATFANAPKGQQRAVTGGDLLIPTVVLDLVRQNIEDYSKLIRRVCFISVTGAARQPIMGTIPEAVWTEACAALNELNFAVNQTEVDGYKVGGYVAICNALLEDTDYEKQNKLTGTAGQFVGFDSAGNAVPASAPMPKAHKAILTAAGWSSSAKTQTITVTGVLADEAKQLIMPMPASASQDAYAAAGIACTAQGANSLTFRCQTVPTADITVYVAVQEVTQG